MPETRYARSSDGSQIAYQVIGDGPVDVLVVAPTFIPIDLLWDEPRAVQFLQRLSSFARHIWFDFRGTGASDGIAATEERLLESWVEDMVAVADDAGCERVALVQLAGAGMGPLFAATHPGRTAAMVLVDTTARVRRAEDYPQGFSDEEFDSVVALGAERIFSVETMAPSLVDDEAFRRWYERAVRLGAPPDIRHRRFVAACHTDVRSVLSSVQTPTLVVSSQPRVLAAQRRYLADHIPGAQFVEVERRGQLSFVDSGPILDAIEEFLTGHLAAPDPDRVLATVLFTDLVASTPQAAEMGDRRWRNLLATHDALVRARSWIASAAARSSPLAMGYSPRLMVPDARSVVRAQSATCSARWAWRCAPGYIPGRLSCAATTSRALPWSSASESPPTPGQVTCSSHEPSPIWSPAPTSNCAPKVSTN